MGALNGIRVLDLSRVLAGPWCGQTLADLGAEVIKIERPKVGDDTRSWGPPWMKDDSGQDTQEAAYYQSTNRNKLSVAIDIASPDGQELIKALIQDTDVVIENYKAGSLKKYGLDYESLSAINPKLVYCSITGFGQTGPRVGSFDAGFGSHELVRLVGTKKAKEIWFLCDQYNADEALQMGLINKIVDYDELENEGIIWANKILQKSPKNCS